MVDAFQIILGAVTRIHVLVLSVALISHLMQVEEVSSVISRERSSLPFSPKDLDQIVSYSCIKNMINSLFCSRYGNSSESLSLMPSQDSGRLGRSCNTKHTHTMMLLLLRRRLLKIRMKTMMIR